MKLSGYYQINQNKQKVWEALNDPEILQKSIPGCEEFKRNSDTNLLPQQQIKLDHSMLLLLVILN